MVDASAPAPARFRRADYLGRPATCRSTRRCAIWSSAETGRRPAGPIRLLTHLRYFGYGFNPVSFYYCFDRARRARRDDRGGESPTRPGASATATCSTPGDNLAERRPVRATASPSPSTSRRSWTLDFDYDWRFAAPGRALAVHMDNRGGRRTLFDATLALRRRAITGRGAGRDAARAIPFMTAKSSPAIYWQALRLLAEAHAFSSASRLEPRHADTGVAHPAKPS